MQLRLCGEVISDDWAELYRYYGYQSGYYCPGDVRDAIGGLEDGEELVLEINSVGGEMYAANEIYSLIQSCPNPTRAVIQSLAASAASYFPLACGRVEIALPAQMMIHCASWTVGGNKTDHRWAADRLEVADASILDVYCARCGGKAGREQLRTLMEQETYLTAHQCLELGLVDAVLGEADQPEPEPLALVANVTSNVVAAMRVLPDIRELKAHRDNEQWRLQAELDLERQRYLTRAIQPEK